MTSLCVCMCVCVCVCVCDGFWGALVAVMRLHRCWVGMVASHLAELSVAWCPQADLLHVMADALATAAMASAGM